MYDEPIVTDPAQLTPAEVQALVRVMDVLGPVELDVEGELKRRASS